LYLFNRENGNAPLQTLLKQRLALSESGLLFFADARLVAKATTTNLSVAKATTTNLSVAKATTTNPYD
jgi:hypothetical protein